LLGVLPWQVYACVLKAIHTLHPHHSQMDLPVVRDSIPESPGSQYMQRIRTDCKTVLHKPALRQGALSLEPHSAQQGIW
jgi:hypothetical protein